MKDKIEEIDIYEDNGTICVLCGKPWLPSIKNRCECGGFCTWGYELGKPLSWIVQEDGKWILNPPSKNL